MRYTYRMNFKKFTIFYFDNLYDSYHSDEYPEDYNSLDEEVYMEQPQSKRIEWVLNKIEEAQKQDLITIITTNDYWLISLIELSIEPDQFCIYNADQNCIVDCFAALKPNPTLNIGEYLFRKSVVRALKGG